MQPSVNQVTTRSWWKPGKGLCWGALLLLVTVSRFALVPGQPWEQDEALFAAASFDTDLLHSRPHPPGFPLWLAVGKVGGWLLGDPLLALQLTSAALSVVSVALLALLWGRALDSRLLGRSAALLFAFAPGVWFHAPRAFTTTPAFALALVAAALWMRPGRRSLLVGAATLAAAVLVRPVAAPMLVVTGCAGCALRRESLRGWLLAGVLAAAVVTAGFVPLVVDSGGPAAFTAAVRDHGVGHADALHLAPWRVEGLGVVRALGTTPVALGVLVLAAFGGWQLGRRRPAVAGWWLVTAVVCTAWILLAHNRTYPRYTVPLLALACGPVVAGVEALLRSRRWAAAAAAAATVAGAAWTLPAMVTIVTDPFPPLEALQAAHTDPRARSVVVDGGLSPFGDLLSLAGRGRLPWFWRPLLAEGRMPVDAVAGPWLHLADHGTSAGWLPPPLATRRTFAVTDPTLGRLAQGRYLECWLADRGAIVLAPVWPDLLPGDALPVPPEGEIGLLLQPTPPRSWVSLVVSVEGGEAFLELDGIRGNGRHATLAPGRHQVHLPVRDHDFRARARPVRIRRLDGGDAVVAVERAWVDHPSGLATPPVIPATDQETGMEGLVEGGGFFPVETFGPELGQGRWTGPEAWLSVPAGDGTLTIDLLAPRPEPATVELACDRPRWTRSVTVTPKVERVEIPIRPPSGRVVLQIRVTNPFVPAAADPASTDERALGVVVGTVRFEPRAER